MALAAAVGLVAVAFPVTSQTPKRGGVLQSVLIEDPPGLIIHESATVSNVWPMAPCYSNLVLFHPLKPLETMDTVMPELAERWSWQDNYRNLVFFLRKNVKWHDGQPFTSKDVKHTFDMVREAKDTTARLRLSPRKDWYANVDGIEAPDPYTVVFKLRRPQPSLLLMLASGYSPVYPAHVPVNELRQRCVGTGPFRLKEYSRGQFVELERNPDYFVTGRPYLDGLRYTIITERGTRLAALQAGRLDAFVPLEMTKAMADTVKKAVPALVGYVGTDERYRFANGAYEQWFGRPVSETVGRHIRDVLGEAVYAAIRPHVQTALSGRRVTFDNALSYGDGKLRYVRATYVPDIDEDGRVRGFVAHVNDISDLKRAEQECEQLRRNADELLALGLGHLVEQRQDEHEALIDLQSP